MRVDPHLVVNVTAIVIIMVMESVIIIIMVIIRNENSREDSITSGIVFRNGKLF